MRTLLVSDLDGTLLRSDATLGPRTVRAVNDLVAAGGLITCATARSFGSTLRVTGGLHLRLPLITYGGTVTVGPDGASGRPVLLPATTTEQVLSVTGGVGVIAFTWRGGRDRLCWWDGHETPGVTSFLTRRAGDPRLLALPSWSALDTAQVFYLAMPGERDALRRLAPSMPRTGVHATLSQDTYQRELWSLEITAQEGTKAAALTRLREQVDCDRVVCFGDNHNDLPLFALADHAVAVGNAVPEVLSAADEVVADNDAEGVAQWIEAHAAELLG